MSLTPETLGNLRRGLYPTVALLVFAGPNIDLLDVKRAAHTHHDTQRTLYYSRYLMNVRGISITLSE